MADGKASGFVSRLERLDTNFIIGVAGDSGSGKTTFTQGIRSILGPELVSSFSLDDYHTEDREARKKSGKLPLDPSINNLSLLAEHLGELKRGNAIVKPVYDHKTGAFGPGVVFKPTRIIIVEGLHTFYTEAIRRSIDFGIYVDPAREVKWRWKVKRDVEKRGHAKSDVEAEMRKREPLYKLFIDPQKIYAEIVIKIQQSRFNPESGVAVELLQEVPRTPMGQIALGLDLSGLMQASAQPFSLEYKGDFYYGKPVARLTFDGEIRREAMAGLERAIQSFTGSDAPILEGKGEYVDAVGLAQMMVCWRFLERMDFLLRDVESALK